MNTRPRLTITAEIATIVTLVVTCLGIIIGTVGVQVDVLPRTLPGFLLVSGVALFSIGIISLGAMGRQFVSARPAAPLAMLILAILGLVLSATSAVIYLTTPADEIPELFPNPTPTVTPTATGVPSQTFELDVSASVFPFASTNIKLQEDDTLLISVENANLWNCGLDDVTVFGVTDSDKQRTALLRSANFCSLIGYMEDGSYFKIEIGKSFKAPGSGIFYLGANDASPEFCSKPEGCFADNKGTLKVKIMVEGKK